MLHQKVEHNAALVHGSPQPVFHTGDFEHDLIQMPFVADPREPTTDPVRKLLAKFARPLPHGFVADDDVASGQELLHHTKTEGSENKATRHGQ
jgi:hypothetical protein